MVIEAVSGYICNMEIHTVNGEKLEDTVLSLLDRNWARIIASISHREYGHAQWTVGVQTQAQHISAANPPFWKSEQELQQEENSCSFPWCVWVDGLYKLTVLSFSSCLVKTISSYPNDQMFEVCFKTTSTSTHCGMCATMAKGGLIFPSPSVCMLTCPPLSTMSS